MSLKNSVEFKGTKEGIILQLDSELEFSDILTKLEDKLEKSGGFFEKAKAEIKSLLGIALYFWVLFTLFAFHKAILNRDHDILVQLGIS